MNSPLTLLAAGLLPIAVLDAQCQQSVEPFAGAPIMASVAQPAVGPTSSALLLKCDGFAAPAAPAPWPAGFGTVPDFDLERGLAGCGVQAGHWPDIDAYSIGQDYIWSDGAGTLVPEPNAWGALTFSVTSGSVVAGSAVIGAEPPGAGRSADVFSFILPGSTYQPPPTVPAPRRRTQRAADSSELGLTGAVELDALDHFTPLYAMDQAGLSTFLPAEPTVYFSVSTATLARVPQAWWSTSLDASGATILSTTWSAATGQWSCPHTFKSWADLGLNQSDDVDALAVDENKQLVLFSTTRQDRRFQLRIHDCGADGPPASEEYKDAGGTPITDQIGIQSDDDDIDAVCAIDPPARLGQPGGPPSNNPMNVAMGFAVGDNPALVFPGVPRTLGATSFLRCQLPGGGGICAPGQTPYRLIGFGWPGPVAGPGLLAGFITNFGPPISIGGTVVRPTSTSCGDPWERTLCVPDVLRLMTPAVEVEVTWLGFDVGSGQFGQSYPNRLRL